MATTAVNEELTSFMSQDTSAMLGFIEAGKWDFVREQVIANLTEVHEEHGPEVAFGRAVMTFLSLSVATELYIKVLLGEEDE